MAIPIIQNANNPFTGVFGTGQIAFFTSSTKWIVPAGINAVRVRLWGAGGGGSSLASYTGGGGGGFALKTIYDLQGATSINVIVGIGSPQNSGQSSSFGSFVSATGGVSSISTSDTLLGGVGVGGDINNKGGNGYNPGGTASGGGGGGAAGLFGNGGDGSSTNGKDGCSGGGAASTATRGGNGIFGNGAYYAAQTYTVVALPAEIGTFKTIPSIDFIATGGGGNNFLSPANGGGASGNNNGAFPGGGGGGGGAVTAGGNGLVIVEY